MTQSTITPDMKMEEILQLFPSAQRALFQRYHVGGCSSCAFQPTDTLEMNVSYLTSDMQGNNLNTNLISLNHQGWWGRAGALGAIVEDAVVDAASNTVQRIEYAPVTWNNAGWMNPGAGQAAAIYRDSELTSDSYSADITWSGENLML